MSRFKKSISIFPYSILFMVQKSGSPVEFGSFSYYLRGFLHPSWVTFSPDFRTPSTRQTSTDWAPQTRQGVANDRMRHCTYGFRPSVSKEKMCVKVQQFAPENVPCQKVSSCQPSFFRGELLNFGGVVISWRYSKMTRIFKKWQGKMEGKQNRTRSPRCFFVVESTAKWF